MTVSTVVTDATTPIRDWLRALAPDPIGARSYVGGLPRSVTLPAQFLERVGGPITETIDVGLYQFDCRGATAPAAKAAAAAVCTALLQLQPRTTVAGHAVVLDGAVVLSSLTLPDPDDPSVHRAVVTAEVTTRTTTP